MSDKLTSIVFLAVVALFLVGFLVSITIVIVRRIGRVPVYKRAAAKFGWEFRGDSEEAIGALKATLDPTLFAMRTGKHELRHVITGNAGGTTFRIARYSYASSSPFGRTRQANTYTLLVFPRKTGGQGLWFTHRRTGALAAAAERMAAGQLSSVDSRGWSWALVSSLDNFSRMALGESDGRELEELTGPGDSVFVFADSIVYTRQGEFRAAWAETVPKVIGTLARVFDR